MDILKLQEGLLKWFWLTPLETKRLPAIENICNKLYEQYFPERLKNAKYEVFHPDIRMPNEPFGFGKDRCGFGRGRLRTGR